MTAREYLQMIEANNIARERNLRANGIPVSAWGSDETLMHGYSLEIPAIHAAEQEARRGA